MTRLTTFKERVERRMDSIDRLDPQVRLLVHQYGYCVVDAFLTLGIRSPRHIKHLVETVLDEFSPTRGSKSSQGIGVKDRGS